jgi:hypothetical protein
VQAIESGIAALLAVAGTVVAVTSASGAAAALYVSAYAVARFTLEPFRGDAVRPYRGGLSQPQWLSLACSAAVVAGGAAGVVPAHPAHVAALVVLAVAAAATLVRHRRDPAAGDPRVEEALLAAVRAALRPQDHTGPPVRVAGVSLSGGTTGAAAHVTLSRPEGDVPLWIVRRVTAMLAALAPGTPSVRRAPSGVVHVVLAPASARAEETAAGLVTADA